MSSANRRVLLCIVSGMSFMYSEKRQGQGLSPGALKIEQASRL